MSSNGGTQDPGGVQERPQQRLADRARPQVERLLPEVIVVTWKPLGRVWT